MRKWSIISALLCCCILGAAEIPVPETEVPYRKGAINFTGSVSDPGWQQAAVVKLEKIPLNMPPETYRIPQATEVRLTYDADFLYIAFFCHDTEIVSAGQQHDDQLFQGDAVEIFIDGIGDHRQFYEIQFNPANLVRDVNYLFTGGKLELDRDGIYTDWPNVWDDPALNLTAIRHKATILKNANGKTTAWLVEAAIPAKYLMRRRNDRKLRPGDELRANFIRLDHTKDQKYTMSYWSATIAGRPHRSPGRMGKLILQK